jgi:hypothetical protein
LRSISGTENRTIKILHAHGYTDPNDGRAPIPVPPSAAVGDTTRSLRLRSATGAEMPAETGAEMPAETGAEMPAETGVETPASSGVETPASSGVETPASSGVEMWMAIATKTVLIE